MTSCLRVIVVSLLLIATAHAADPVRLGLLHTLSPAPFYIAQERGYFRDEGIDLTFRFFEAAQPIAAAAVSGDIDRRDRADRRVLQPRREGRAEGDRRRPARTTRLRGVRDPGFQQGVRGRPDLARTNYRPRLRHRAIRLIIPLHAWPHRRGRTFRCRQRDAAAGAAIANVVAAVGSDQVDATIAITSMAKPLAAGGQVHIIGWAGDIVAVSDHRRCSPPVPMIAQQPMC